MYLIPLSVRTVRLSLAHRTLSNIFPHWPHGHLLLTTVSLSYFPQHRYGFSTPQRMFLWAVLLMILHSSGLVLQCVSRVLHMLAAHHILHHVVDYIIFMSHIFVTHNQCHSKSSASLEACTVYGDRTVCSCRHSKSSAWVRSMYCEWRPYHVQL